MTGEERKKVLATMAERLSENDKGAVMAMMACRLREYRKDHMFTQEEMAERVGVTVRQYRKYETGKAFPHASTIYTMALVMNVLPGWIMGAEGKDGGGK